MTERIEITDLIRRLQIPMSRDKGFGRVNDVPRIHGEAVAAIRLLLADIAELRAKISEYERGPSEIKEFIPGTWYPIEGAPLRDVVIIHHEDYYVRLATEIEDGSWWEWPTPDGELKYKPTHWSPIPEPPK